MDTIEILSPDLLDEHAVQIESLRNLADRLEIQLGWHYELDLAWIASQLDNPASIQVLDAGAGTGVLQWWLADHGARVVSVDLFDRADLSGRFRLAFDVRGLGDGDLNSSWQMAQTRIRETGRWDISRLKSVARAITTAIAEPILPKPPGQVTLYRHDLISLPLLADDSFDAVVSVSALEHNAPSNLPDVINELRRVLKPGGVLLITMAATDKEDWFHEPSAGWCLTEASLRQSFNLSQDKLSNFDDFDSIMDDTRSSKDMQSRLAPAYFQSGDNGMPWGVWDPKYLPVGIRTENP